MSDFYVEIDCQQKHHFNERICGDVFLTRYVREESRTIVVLSDGMGHGVKANMLATLTATMAVNFSQEHKAPRRIAQVIMKTLPECSVRNISYATFTVIDIEPDGIVNIIEFNNPSTFVFRKGRQYVPGWKCLLLEDENLKGKEIKICQFTAKKNDRIVFCSDGVTQCGMGSRDYPFGWGEDGVSGFVKKTLQNRPYISAKQLNARVIKAASKLDRYRLKDDTSCASVYFRDPRKLLVVTGPPYEEKNDPQIAKRLESFDGKKIIMGATTADIIARELGITVTDDQEIFDNELSPASAMEGVDLVTEGILTLGKVERILNNYKPNQLLSKGPADWVVKLFLDSDHIHFLVGTRINEAHQDPEIPVDLEIRRTVVKRIGEMLSDKFLKKTEISYI
jgi:hypothetical protein